MSKRLIKLTEVDYKDIRSILTSIIDSYENIRGLTMYMNFITKDTLEYYLKAPIHDYLFGVKIKEDITLDSNVIELYYHDNYKGYINSLYGMFVTDHINLFDNNKSVTLPDRYIVNKDAAILFYGNNKTIVRRSRGDKVDPIKAFLWAYFLRNTGMSRTKANKYLQKVWKAAVEEIHKK